MGFALEDTGTGTEYRFKFAFDEAVETGVR
jgi:hypothetical protein